MLDETALLITTPQDKVKLITLNRPAKRNALDGSLVKTWLQALNEIAHDETTQIVMFAANGPHFCAGADIAWMQKMAEAKDAENVQDARYLANLLYAIYTLPQPTISLVQGSVLGGGLGVIASSDFVLATEDATFGFPEVQIGLTPSVVSPYVLAALGERATRYYFLTAEKFTASTALTLGLIHRLVTHDQLLAAGLELAATLLKHSSHALAEVKKLLARVKGEKISCELAQSTAGHLATMRASVEAKTRLAAFLAKKKLA